MKRSSPSIGRRLMNLSVASSATALLLAGILLFAYDVRDVRRTVVARLASVADLIAYNSASSIDFNDADSARLILQSLQTRPGIVSAVIVVDGRPFATFIRPGESLPGLDALPPDGSNSRFTDRHLIVSTEIRSKGRHLGSLLIKSDLATIHQRRKEYGVILLLVFAIAVLVTTILSRRLRNTISRPILDLAALSRDVSSHHDYSLRARETRSVAELEQLITTFNEMLAEGQASRTMLEQRVEERTRELAAANKELEAFSYSVSHDLRAPLRAIDGFSKVLIQNYSDKPLDARGLHFLERVRSGTQRMGTLIDDMLGLARVTRSTLERRDTDVTAIAQGVAGELERRNEGRSVEFRIEEGMTACADPDLLSIVFDNLLGNAWKFTSKKNEALIEVGRTIRHSEELFFVKDNGDGFDMTYAGKLFTAFQRLHDDSDFEGTGIGLATVQRIIHRHGGHISAEAVEGAGATFFFTLGATS